MTILVFTDKLGITDGYKPHWQSLCLNAGLSPQHMPQVTIWKTRLGYSGKLLIQKGNRKSPGFNPAVHDQVKAWFETQLDTYPSLEAVLIQDMALLGMVEPKWENAILDNLRGGVYEYKHGSRVILVLVSLPISAINSKKTPKDIRALNGGAESKDDWEERRERELESGDSEEITEEIFLEPYVIPYGRFVLFRDLMKLNRIITNGIQ